MTTLWLLTVMTYALTDTQADVFATWLFAFTGHGLARLAIASGLGKASQLPADLERVYCLSANVLALCSDLQHP